LGTTSQIEVGSGVLNYSKDAVPGHPTATVTLTRAALDAIVLGQATVESLAADGAVTIAGDAAAFVDIVELLDTFEFWFDIVTP
jgi:alkyl sulfatase BDS1-like metallo-beta-lactamase superfamily hydrolase